MERGKIHYCLTFLKWLTHYCVDEDLKLLPILCMYYRIKIYSRFSRNSEPNISEFIFIFYVFLLLVVVCES